MIKINWTTPKTDCELTSYELLWTEEVLWLDEGSVDNSVILSGDQEYFYINDTNPYSKYYVAIRPVVEDSTEGPWTISSEIQTPQTGTSNFFEHIILLLSISCQFTGTLTLVRTSSILRWTDFLFSKTNS